MFSDDGDLRGVAQTRPRRRSSICPMYVGDQNGFLSSLWLLQTISNLAVVDGVLGALGFPACPVARSSPITFSTASAVHRPPLTATTPRPGRIAAISAKPASSFRMRADMRTHIPTSSPHSTLSATSRASFAAIQARWPIQVAGRF